METRIGLQRHTRKRDRTGRQLLGGRIGVFRPDDCDFMTTPTQFLVQEPCLERCTVGVGNSGEVTEDGHTQRTTVPR
ncbi:hypothetical protein AKJ09_08232 [Labilithrix luteola]|uniref:Uncharacterized protein n=1 Tax=Labilithrix luteola TaxID=1391654 RepID=A0A0K1Q766_9BACT|nr:hypothetical protein AKJ09_08232 [Labilithrix luteola]